MEFLSEAGEPISDGEALYLGGWAGSDSKISNHVLRLSRQCLDAYRANPLLVVEHANIERAMAQGGYGRRQLYELVQNGADALLSTQGGRIHVLLTDEALYCANEGEPITTDGIDAILSSHISMKRGVEIGRFGLGFKSVLGVTTCPEFYSRTGSFSFDGEDAKRRISEVVPDSDRFPTLRLARPLDPYAAVHDDPVLYALMKWASTVVKLPRQLVSSEWLSQDIANFPAGFLLFSPHVGKLILEDRVRSILREIRVSSSGRLISLEEDGASSMWQVFERRYVPSATARKDAGELADRESLPLMWAVPVEGRAALARGQFWAFFPTEYVTTLSGIINAPWKTNEDRQALLTGVFNEELIDAAAHLIADSLSQIETGGDPGRFLDLMPARGREAPHWADSWLTDRVYTYAADAPIIPDQNGVRRRAGELHLHPAGLPRESLEIWAGYPHRPHQWCHHSVDSSTQRRSRVERLFGSERPAAGLAPWLEALVLDRTPASSLTALRAAAAILKAPNATTSTKSDVGYARIVLTQGGTFVRPKPGAVFLSSSTAVTQANVSLVHEMLTASEEGRTALTALGIGEVDASSELQALIASMQLTTLSSQHPDNFWRLVERIPLDAAVGILKPYFSNFPWQLKVRTADGHYRPLRQTLLPGDIVPSDGSRDANVAIDTQFHAKTLTLLVELGAVTSPQPHARLTDERWYQPYRQDALQRLTSLLDGKSSPHEGLLHFDQSTTTRPLEPLYELSDEGRARFTERLMLAAVDEPVWTLYHKTRSDYYPAPQMDPPSIWVAIREGRVRTSLGIRAVPDAVGSGLAEWKRVLPVAQYGENTCRRLHLQDSAESLLPGQWDAALETAKSLDDERYLGRFYALAARHVPAPAQIRCRSGAQYTLISPSAVAVAHQPNEIRALTQAAIPFLAVVTSDDVALLHERWQLRTAGQVITVAIHAAPSGPETPLVDRFPGLSPHLTEDRHVLTLLPCSSLRLDTVTAEGQIGEERSVLPEADVLYHADRLGHSELLDQICYLLGIDLAPTEREAILEQRELNDSRQRLLDIRTKPALAEKLLAAVGATALRRRLPLALLSAAEEHYGTLSDLRLAELALAVYGVETLHEFRDELLCARLSPPQQWSASYNARQFVQQLGFPKEFAGFQERRRDAVLEVEGPPHLPKLHPFQEAIVKRIHKLLSGQAHSRRGLLSLPTGAGKTRVAVESLIRAAASHTIEGPILWIAQTDELCEQAVQTWSEVWRAYGARERLHINRLWASNEADLYDSGVQVVVATDAKLTAACLGNPLYEWLTEAKCVVIDEAHISTGPSYTSILEWLGFHPRHEPCPLIGLTATPFKGGEDQTSFLAGRYGRYRFDANVLGDEPYAKLQQMGVLAQVDHQLLDGSTYELTTKELQNLNQMKSLPASVADKIGADTSRNKSLLSSIRTLPTDWPVLLFAASVDHARTMAALLSAEGISAAAISAATDSGARRHYIEQFRRGQLRVLANYAVLAAGFDAPSIRALYVARPTYSPAAYQQMIGRGLRGPLNGGKERCLIVNVRDNILQYGEQLAFTRFEYLWNGS